MTDWSEWVAACKRFIKGVDSWPIAEDFGPNQWRIGPPISEDAVIQIESLMGRSFPLELREFYLTGSGGMDCNWYWSPRDEYQETVRDIFREDGVGGGPAIIDAQSQIEHHSTATGLLGDWLRYGRPSAQERAVAENLFPLVEVRNGDGLFLHVPESGRGGKVYYFYHELSESPLIEISASFEAFMLAWQYLYYVGPEGWMFTPFMEIENGCCCRINTTLPNATKWRNLVAHLQATYGAG